MQRSVMPRGRKEQFLLLVAVTLNLLLVIHQATSYVACPVGTKTASIKQERDQMWPLWVCLSIKQVTTSHT